MEEFLDHIKVSYKILSEGSPLGQNPFVKTWLMESRGIPSQLDEMLDKILDAPIWEKAYKRFNKTTRRGVVAVDMWDLTKDVYRNFLGPGSVLKITFEESSWIHPDCYGAYAGAVTAKWNKEECYLEHASIELTCDTPANLNFDIVKRYIRSTLAHELVHAYEDFNRRVLSAKTLSRALGDRNYTPPKQDRDVLDIFAYILDPAEQKAFIASAITDIKSTVKALRKAGRLDQFENIRNFEHLLKYTRFWNRYRDLRNFVEHSQWDRFPEHLQKKLLDRYNKIVGGESTVSRKPETYNQLLKKIRNRWYKFDQTLKTKVGQAAAEALYEKYPNDPSLREDKDKPSAFDLLINQAY